MTPVGGVYVGWWPDEGAGLSWIAAYGIPVIASDWFDNASLFGGITNPIIIPPIPPLPPLQNKVYVSITLSDGDNVQYMQHHMKNNWGNAARGRVPMGWTTQPLAADIDPGMLNYYWSSATSNDCLVAGPSGAGYTRLNFWGPANANAFTIATEPYLQRTGIRSITVWSSLSSATAHYYAANCPTLLGINDFGNGSYATNFGALPTIGFPGSANYASAVTNLINGVTNSAAGWSGSSPMFIAVEGNGWSITPADCQTVANALNTNQYIIVRPDHLFMLYQQAAGLTNSGPPRIVENIPTTVKLPAGFPLSLTVYPLGAQPLSFRWQFNGVVLANSDRVAGAQSPSLTVKPMFPADNGQYRAIISNALGSVTSAVATVSVGRDALNSPAGWSRNGRAGLLTNNSVMLTDGNPSEASSIFLNSPQYVGAFVASFTYQDVGGGGADGCVFILHNDSAGPWALGAPGGSLGCSGITPAVALEFNIYSPNGVGMVVRTNGQTGAPYNNTAPVNLASGNSIGASLVYTGSTFSIALTDTVTHAIFVTNVPLNIPAVLGTNTAYVGFTAADGGISSRQIVSNFQFVGLVSLAAERNNSNTLVVTWLNSGGGLVLQQIPSLGSVWSSVTDAVSLENNYINQMTIPFQAATKYYRLATP